MIDLLVGPVSSLLDKFIPDADERNRLAHEIATMSERHRHEVNKAQMEINKTEAAHKSLFVAGWRPALPQKSSSFFSLYAFGFFQRPHTTKTQHTNEHRHHCL